MNYVPILSVVTIVKWGGGICDLIISCLHVDKVFPIDGLYYTHSIHIYPG